MSVEQRSETLIDAWPQWQGAVINGVYPLRRVLHGSDHSAVFLTEYEAAEVAAAAIKIVPAERVTLAQLSHWRTAAGLSHPHLMRLLDTGLYQFGGRQFLFVVMEYAEQTLAQVLPNRALTGDEVREMLVPTLDALAFLHANNLVQGQLKPANFLVVDDQLKLASDTVRPAGEPSASRAVPSLYDPPEAKNGGLSAAGDIWGLGITVVEALTQCLPWPDEHSATTCLPLTLPPEFADPIQRCLNLNPASRPTAAELNAHFKRPPPAAVVSVAPPAVREVPTAAAPASEPPPRHSRVSTLVAAACLILLVAIWAGLRLFHGHTGSPPPTAGVAQSVSAPAAAAPVVAAHNPQTLAPASARGSAAPVNAKSRVPKAPRPSPASFRPEQPPSPQTDPSPDILHEQIPVAAPSALRSIHGHVKVAVLVRVDRSGNVSDSVLENPGPSAYFARVAREAADKWKFAATDEPDSRQWLLRFEFSSAGATAHATSRH